MRYTGKYVGDLIIKKEDDASETGYCFYWCSFGLEGNEMKKLSFDVDFKCEYAGHLPKTKTNDRAHYAWRVNIRGFETNYKTGVGLVKQGVQTPPSINDILYSLTNDARLGADTFRDFCENLRFDIDSRKALDSYLECQKTAHFLRTAFTSDERAEMDKFFRDY
jgi:hypothetical protein